MFVIINGDNKFYSLTDNGVVFTTDFVKADVFDTREEATQAWEKNKTENDIVIFEKV